MERLETPLDCLRVLKDYPRPLTELMRHPSRLDAAIVDDPTKAIHILGDHGVLVVETDVLAVEVPDAPGELSKIALKLARGKVNIEYAYGTSDAHQAMIYIRVSDVPKGEQILSP